MGIDPQSLSVHVAALRVHRSWRACPLVQSRIAGMFVFVVDMFV